VLDRLDLRITDGEDLAVVGPSGIGKSTLADVLCGITAPDGGQVLLGGVPLDRVGARELARLRVLLPQDAYVFGGPLRDNLRWQAPGATDGTVVDAARALGAEGLVARLGGLDATVDPAVLSAGERQQIALVRACLSPARLVVLDEATRHLAAVAEQCAERAFRRRPGTLVSITHRAGPTGSCCSTGPGPGSAPTPNSWRPRRSTPTWWAPGTPPADHLPSGRSVSSPGGPSGRSSSRRAAGGAR
jgi:ATP-binding cassette subfamily C protein